MSNMWNMLIIIIGEHASSYFPFCGTNNHARKSGGKPSEWSARDYGYQYGNEGISTYFGFLVLFLFESFRKVRIFEGFSSPVLMGSVCFAYSRFKVIVSSIHWLEKMFWQWRRARAKSFSPQEKLLPQNNSWQIFLCTSVHQLLLPITTLRKITESRRMSQMDIFFTLSHHYMSFISFWKWKELSPLGPPKSWRKSLQNVKCELWPQLWKFQFED